jgi:hypothetical protein
VLLIDLSGKGLALTNVENGVNFDLDGVGSKKRISWTTANSGGAFLFLDSNGDHLVDNGLELFGNFTNQLPSTREPNGFLALVYSGYVITNRTDAVEISSIHPLFSKLRLWEDINHDGVSQSNELHTLKEAGIESISLDFRESRRSDSNGNLFRYQADVYGAHHTKIGTAYDVILLPHR